MVGIDWRAFSHGPDYVIWILNDSLCNKEGQKMKISSLGSININELGKIEIRLNSDLVCFKNRFVTAMLLGHYWQYLGQHKGVEFSNFAKLVVYAKNSLQGQLTGL